MNDKHAQEVELFRAIELQEVEVRVQQSHGDLYSYCSGSGESA